MGAGEILSTSLRFVLLVAGLLVPGAALLRALRLPRILAGCFIASAAILYGSIVVFTLLHVRINLVTLCGALGVVTLVALFFARRKTGQPVPADSVRCYSFLAELGAWSPLYLVFWAVILWRLTTQPLNGGDIDFRWSWLAEQVVRTGSLDFYPPLSAADFAKYFWVESIPPGVAGLHAWSYLCGGSLREIWTSPGVLLQLLALHDLIWRLAFGWGGRDAARRAVMLAVAAPMLNWSAIMGQETGLTAVAVTGIFLGLVRWRETRVTSWLVFAALAAFAGSSTREYGPAFPLLGIVGLLLMRAPIRAILTFAALALLPSLAWPLRTWALTGNPVYSLGAGGLFPTNALFVEWAASIASGSRGIFATSDAWWQLVRYLLLCAPAAILCWLAVSVQAFRRQPEALWCAAGILLIGALWFTSVPYTGGGLFYSLRVLSPAFALGAVFGGVSLANSNSSSRQRAALNLGILILVVATLPMTLTLPHNAYHLAPREWPKVGRLFVDDRRDADAEVAKQLVALPNHERILSECVSLPRALQSSGITVVPMWSPEVSWLFDSKVPPADVARRWRESGLRYVVMTRSPRQLELLTRRAAWVAPYFAITRIWQSGGYVIFEVQATDLAASR
ncbi:MAG: Dolichyl-phosphate-mannose-protein mannosyltransferase [Verrucomicrobia bacterium]|nr:Dolichyl-phosphate-mannose-protein mannosyltransferase [Verrucomicrobiota bacterium]